MITSFLRHRTAGRGLVATLSALTLLVPVAATATVDTSHLVTAFGPRGAVFVESLAIDSHGNAFATKTHWGTVNHGQVVRISTAEQQSAFGPRIDLGAYGMLAGVATNAADQVYAARAEFGGSSPSVIYRVEPKQVVVVATLPAGSFPNGLTFHHGLLYVSDPALGAIWRFHPSSDRVRHLTTAWVRGAALKPPSADALGINGIAFWGNTLYGVNSGKGLLVRVPMKSDASAGSVVRVVRSPDLVTADGIAFNRTGELWVVGNGTGKAGKFPPKGQFLTLMTRTGQAWDRTVDAPWMNYPTALAIGRSTATAQRMFVTNGAFDGGTATLVSFTLGG